MRTAIMTVSIIGLRKLLNISYNSLPASRGQHFSRLNTKLVRGHNIPDYADIDTMSFGVTNQNKFWTWLASMIMAEHPFFLVTVLRDKTSVVVAVNINYLHNSRIDAGEEGRCSGARRHSARRSRT